MYPPRCWFDGHRYLDRFDGVDEKMGIGNEQEKTVEVSDSGLVRSNEGETTVCWLVGHG